MAMEAGFSPGRSVGVGARGWSLTGLVGMIWRGAEHVRAEVVAGDLSVGGGFDFYTIFGGHRAV